MKKIGILILTALMIVMPLEGFADNADLNYVIEQTPILNGEKWHKFSIICLEEQSLYENEK